MDESVQQYLLQLSQVEEALKATSDDAERQSLLSLKNDLNELLNLTIELQDQNEKPSNETAPNNDDNLQDEMDLFMSEIRQMDGEEKESTGKCNKVDKSISIVGTRCVAPFTHSWGGKSFQNAMICEDNRASSDMVRVLFTNPTHQEMVPCTYYLDGHCRFDEDKCRFSHGQLVPYGDVREYREPNFQLLTKSKCQVFVRMDDKLWHKGFVKTVDHEKRICKIQLQQRKHETMSDFEHILPIESDGDGSSSDDSDTDDSSLNNDNDDDDLKVMHQIEMVEKSLLAVPTDRLGQWEEHTRGIGSRLMQRMGYVIGTGLGRNGEGIVLPVGAQVLPPGRSLDHCMNLREQANGDKNLFSVERKLKQMAKKQVAANLKAYEREKNRESNVFDFINNEIFTSATSLGGSNKPSTSSNTSSKSIIPKHTVNSLRTESSKELNKASFEIGETIKKKEREIQSLQQALQRQKPNSQIHKNIQTKLDVQNLELATLKNSENQIEKEQKSRNVKNKMFIL